MTTTIVLYRRVGLFDYFRMKSEPVRNSPTKTIPLPDYGQARVTTDAGNASVDFASLIKLLNETISWIRLELPQGDVLTLGLKSGAGSSPGLRLHLRSRDGSELCTQRVTNEEKILSTLKSFASSGSIGDAFHWSTVRDFRFDHEDSSLPRFGEKTPNVTRKLRKAFQPSFAPRNANLPTGCIVALVLLVISVGSIWLTDKLLSDLLFSKKQPSKVETPSQTERAKQTEPQSVAKSRDDDDGGGYRSISHIQMVPGTALYWKTAHTPVGFIVDVSWTSVWVADSYSVGSRNLRLYAREYKREYVMKHFVIK